MSFRIRIAAVIVVFVAVAAAVVAYDPKGLRLWWRLGDDVSQLDRENTALVAEKDALQKKANALHADAHSLERAARENGYVRPNEILVELK